MSCKSETFAVGGKEIEVKELTVRQIISILERSPDPNGNLTLTQEFNRLLKLSDISLDDFLDLAPSEIQSLWLKFKEVNNTFFELAQKMGVQDLLSSIIGDLKEEIKKTLEEKSSKLLADS